MNNWDRYKLLYIQHHIWGPTEESRAFFNEMKRYVKKGTYVWVWPSGELELQVILTIPIDEAISKSLGVIDGTKEDKRE